MTIEATPQQGVKLKLKLSNPSERSPDKQSTTTTTGSTTSVTSTATPTGKSKRSPTSTAGSTTAPGSNITGTNSVTSLATSTGTAGGQKRKTKEEGKDGEGNKTQSSPMTGAPIKENEGEAGAEKKKRKKKQTKIQASDLYEGLVKDKTSKPRRWKCGYTTDLNVFGYPLNIPVWTTNEPRKIVDSSAAPSSDPALKKAEDKTSPPKPLASTLSVAQIMMTTIAPTSASKVSSPKRVTPASPKTGKIVVPPTGDILMTVMTPGGSKK